MRRFPRPNICLIYNMRVSLFIRVHFLTLSLPIVILYSANMWSSCWTMSLSDILRAFSAMAFSRVIHAWWWADCGSSYNSHLYKILISHDLFVTFESLTCHHVRAQSVTQSRTQVINSKCQNSVRRWLLYGDVYLMCHLLRFIDAVRWTTKKRKSGTKKK